MFGDDKIVIENLRVHFRLWWRLGISGLFEGLGFNISDNIMTGSEMIGTNIGYTFTSNSMAE